MNHVVQVTREVSGHEGKVEVLADLQTTSAVVAAQSLRAVANLLDPPKPKDPVYRGEK